MGNTTYYDVALRYRVENKGAAAQTKQLTDQTKQLARESKAASLGLGRLGAAAAGLFGIRQAYGALIGFNSQVQDAKIQIAGMLSLSKNTSFGDEVGRADALYASLQKRAATLPGTTKDYVQMAGMITQPIMDAGLSMKTLEDLTVNAAVGAKALGVQADAAARDIDQALRGQYHSTDVFTGKILGSAGYKGEEGRAKYNALSQAERADVLKNALMRDQLTDMARAQGESFGGMIGQLQDSIEQFAGKVGKPIFAALTNELKGWGTWLDENSAKVDAFASRLADGLMTGFNAVKTAMGFIVDHAGELIAIGKVWAAVKIGGMLGDKLGDLGKGGGGAIAGLFGQNFGGTGGFFRKASDRFNPESGEYEVSGAGRGRQSWRAGGMSGALGNLGLVAQAGMVGYAIGDTINKWTGASDAISDTLLSKLNPSAFKLNSQIDALENSMRSLDAATESAAKKMGGRTAATNLIGMADEARQKANLLRDAERLYRAGRGGNIDAMRGYAEKRDALTAMGVTMGDVMKAGGAGALAKQYETQAAGWEEKGTKAQSLTAFMMNDVISKMTEAQRDGVDLEGAQLRILEEMVRSGNMLGTVDVAKIMMDFISDNGKPKTKANAVNINIQRIEVQSDDPDRYAFGLVEAFRDAVRNPGEAAARATRVR